MRVLPLVLLAGLLTTLAGCGLFSSEEARFLCKAQDRATQADIRQRLGEPVVATSGAEGESVWVYQMRALQAGSRMNAPGTWCDEYVLTFDRQNVLRNWTHQKQFHGGETQPHYCVQNGYRQAS